MMRGRLLFVLWCFSILAAARSITVSCVSDYVTNITCVVNGIDIKPDNNLKFTYVKSNTCPIVATDQGYFCNCEVSDSEMAAFYKYEINFCNASFCKVVQSEFRPRLNIKLSPPPAVDLQKSTDYINITCESDRYKTHMYLENKLKYEALLQESHSSWNRTVSLPPSKNYYAIPRKALLKQNTEYCVKARFKAEDKSDQQQSTWSEWGEPVCWTNEQMTEQKDIVPILLKSLGPACLIIGILLFVFYNPATRMKIKILGRTPTPAPFFKPLFQQHDGNLQEWLSPHGKYDLTYKTEEDLITDAVTVVPKSSPKDLEENQVFLTSPGTQLVFPLSHTSYVGFPGMEKASAPPYPGDTPYTQLPCSVLSPCVQNVEVVCSVPKGFLEISRSDSGCSCEDLTQSPECSLPCSPVDEIPTPRHCSDYCILNKTAQGVVPVLLSKERPADVPDHSLKSEG